VRTHNPFHRTNGMPAGGADPGGSATGRRASAAARGLIFLTDTGVKANQARHDDNVLVDVIEMLPGACACRSPVRRDSTV
jgi:hypothetical protein